MTAYGFVPVVPIASCVCTATMFEMNAVNGNLHGFHSTASSLDALSSHVNASSNANSSATSMAQHFAMYSSIPISSVLPLSLPLGLSSMPPSGTVLPRVGGAVQSALQFAPASGAGPTLVLNSVPSVNVVAAASSAPRSTTPTATALTPTSTANTTPTGRRRKANTSGDECCCKVPEFLFNHFVLCFPGSIAS